MKEKLTDEDRNRMWQAVVDDFNAQHGECMRVHSATRDDGFTSISCEIRWAHLFRNGMSTRREMVGYIEDVKQHILTNIELLARLARGVCCPYEGNVGWVDENGDKMLSPWYRSNGQPLKRE